MRERSNLVRVTQKRYREGETERQRHSVMRVPK